MEIASNLEVVNHTREGEDESVGQGKEATSSLLKMAHQKEVERNPSSIKVFFQDEVLKEELVDDPSEVVTEDEANPSVSTANLVVVQEGTGSVSDEMAQMCNVGDDYVKTEKEKRAKTFQCEHCAWVCNSLSNLKKHRMIHTGERPHTCPDCHKTFRQIHHLKDHIRTHTGERPFKCNECGSTFAQRSSLNVHKRKHTGIKPHVCKICDHATYEKEHMVIHMRTHTGEKPYQCDECGQTFSTMTRLKFHIMIHTGERRYACEKCGARFREKATLQKHRGVHLKKGPFPCKTCGKEFPRLASLSLHRRIHEQQIYPLAENNLNAHQMPANIDSETNCHSPAKSVEQYSKKDCVINKPCSYDGISLETGSVDLDNAQGKQIYFSEIQGNPVDGHGISQNIYPERQENVILESSVIDSSFTNGETSIHTDNESQNVISIAHPDQVQKALESGTVWETQQNGEELLVIIPPSLAGREITLVSDGNPMDNREPTFPQSAPQQIFHMSHNQAELVQEYPPVIQEEIQEKIPQNHPHILREEHSSGVQAYPMVLQEEIHDDNSGLLVWDDGLDPVTEVTYVIEEGTQDPIMIHQDQTPFEPRTEVVTEVTRKRKKTNDLWVMDGNEKPKKQRSETGRPVMVKTRIKKKRQVDKKVRVRKDYDCPQCGKACKTASNYSTHMRMHTGERPYFCNFCGMGFKQIPHLRSHIRTHTGEKPYSCPNCNACFTQTSRLNIHKKKCQKGAPVVAKKPKLEPAFKVRNFYCKICDKTFIDECFKRDHMKTHIESNQYTCDICGLTFKNKMSIQKHKKIHSKCICVLCGESFNSKYSLNMHNATKHKSNEAKNNTSGMVISVKIGEEKDFVVINPSIKNVERNSRNDIEIKAEAIEIAEADNCPIKREIIQITDAADGTVKSEVMSGIDDESIQFPDYQETDIEKSVDGNEMKTEAQDLFMADAPQKEEQILAPTKMVKEEGGSRKYKVMIDDQGRKMFICKVCDRAFLQSSNLLSHMRMHTGEKPYKCNVCSLAFRQITHLKDHMHTHTGVRAFKCGICKMAFSQRSAARRHVKTVHDHNADVVKIGNVYSVRGSLPNKSNEQSLVTDEMHQINKIKMKNGKASEKTLETCDHCDKKYSTSYMKIHLRCHSGERPFSCDECGQSFKQKAHLLSHKLRHSGIKPYVCEFCNVSYTQGFRYREHKKKCMRENSNENSGEIAVGRKGMEKIKANMKKDFVCECGTTFKTQNAFTNHKRKCKTLHEDSDHSTDVSEEEITYNDDSDEENEPMNSKIGTKRNKEMRPSQVTKDEKIKQYACSKCDCIFDDFLLYKDHVQEHGSSFTEVCEECGMVFRRASALLFHQKMNHNKSNDEWSYGYSDEKEVLVKEELVNSDEKEFEDSDYDEHADLKRENIRSPLRTPKKELKESASKENSELNTRSKRNTRGKSNSEVPLTLKEKERNVIKNRKNTDVETSDDMDRKNKGNSSNARDKSASEIDCDNDTTEMQYPCKLCGQTFTRSSKLKHHLNMWCKGMKNETKI